MKCGFIKMSLLLESSHTEEQVRLPMTGKFSNKYFVQFTLCVLLGLIKQNFSIKMYSWSFLKNFIASCRQNLFYWLLSILVLLNVLLHVRTDQTHFISWSYLLTSFYWGCETMEMCKAWRRFQVYTLNFTKNISSYLLQIFIK